MHEIRDRRRSDDIGRFCESSPRRLFRRRARPVFIHSFGIRRLLITHAGYQRWVRPEFVLGLVRRHAGAVSPSEQLSRDRDVSADDRPVHDLDPAELLKLRHVAADEERVRVVAAARGTGSVALVLDLLSRFTPHSRSPCLPQSRVPQDHPGLRTARARAKRRHRARREEEEAGREEEQATP